MKRLCILFACVLIAPPVLSQQNSSTPDSACGPTHVKFNVKTQKGTQPSISPAEGKALIYVIEDYQKPANQIGGGPIVKVGLDGQWIGALRGNSYLLFSVDSGQHHLCANWQSVLKTFSKLVSLDDVNVQPRASYYFRARAVLSSNHGPYTLDLQRINPAEANLLLSKYPLAVSQAKK